MKGQEKIEFIVSAFIFFSVILIIGSYFSDKVVSIYSDDYSLTQKIKAERIIDILTKERGIPENWEYIGSTPIRLGLAEAPFNLSQDKVKALNSTSCAVFEKSYGISNFRIILINLTDNKKLLECGSYGGLKARSERIGYLGETPVKIVLELWW